MFFSQDWRERIKAENPDAGFGEYSLAHGVMAVADDMRRRGRQASRSQVEGARRRGEEALHRAGQRGQASRRGSEDGL